MFPISNWQNRESIADPAIFEKKLYELEILRADDSKEELGIF